MIMVIIGINGKMGNKVYEFFKNSYEIIGVDKFLAFLVRDIVTAGSQIAGVDNKVGACVLCPLVDKVQIFKSTAVKNAGIVMNIGKNREFHKLYQALTL